MLVHNSTTLFNNLTTISPLTPHHSIKLTHLFPPTPLSLIGQPIQLTHQINPLDLIFTTVSSTSGYVQAPQGLTKRRMLNVFRICAYHPLVGHSFSEDNIAMNNNHIFLGKINNASRFHCCVLCLEGDTICQDIVMYVCQSVGR
jgi:hypothetical protein